VRFAGDRIQLSGGELPQEVGATPSIEGNELVISMGSTATSLRLSLPQLGRGIQYRGVAVAGDQALLTVHMARARLLGQLGL